MLTPSAANVTLSVHAVVFALNYANQNDSLPEPRQNFVGKSKTSLQQGVEVSD